MEIPSLYTLSQMITILSINYERFFSVLSKSSGYRTMVLGYDVTDPREDVRLEGLGRI